MEVKEAAKKGAKLYAVKKGFEWSGSLLKLGALAGLGYLAYKFFSNEK